MTQHASPRKRTEQILVERDRRAREALSCYRPLLTQVPFHSSPAKFRILRGGNRSGKSVSAAAEFASCLTNRKIVGPDGKDLPWNYPAHRKVAWVIGWDQDHIGQTLHRLLFEEGLFRVIRDERTKEWRTFNPAAEFDAAYAEKAIDAEPLIPERFCDTSLNNKGFAWEDRAKKVFASVHLKNGNVIYAFPSTGLQAKQGDIVDILWIDEDVRWPEHVQEYRRRLVDRKGRFIWSVWPHTSNDALMRMSGEAEKQEHRDKKNFFEVVLRSSDNPFIDEEERRIANEGCTPEEIRARDYGEFLFDTILMYEFRREVHGIGSLVA